MVVLLLGLWMLLGSDNIKLNFFLLCHVVFSLCGGGWVVVVSQQLLSLNPTTVMVVLLLGLWLLLGCDNIRPKSPA